MTRSLSAVIPVYCSEGSLPLLLEQLAPALAALADEFEVVMVNDASKDGSWQVIRELATRYDFVRGINLMRNYGQHNALLCGIRAARYDVIVTLDDDLQHRPSEIHKLLAKLDEGYDVVYGPPEHEQHGLLRDLASRMTKVALQNAMGAETARRISAFRVFRTHLRNAFQGFRSPFASVDVLLTWGTTRFAAVSVPHDPREIGTSNYTFRMLVTHAFNMMTGFSVVPLQLASLMGVVFAFFGVAVLAYVVGRYVIEGGSVPGFPFLASTVAIFSGVQLLSLGIIGEYLARVHLRTMERPTYAVLSDTGADAAAKGSAVDGPTAGEQAPPVDGA